MTTAVMPKKRFPRPSAALIFGAILLSAAYGLLGLTQFQHPEMMELHARCVLMNARLARIWSVANVEIGLSYFGVFGAMSYYVLATREARDRHLNDLLLACLYLVCSFVLDLTCVHFLQPFPALLIGDAIVMTFTLLVSRQLWFQRLLGVFVPMVFLTCGMGHFLEGLSYWQKTYPLNVPWAMVTADVGFAVLVNAARYPSFIRGSDVAADLAEAEESAKMQSQFFHNVLHSVTDGRFRFVMSSEDLPSALPTLSQILHLTRDSLSSIRGQIAEAANARQFEPQQKDNLLTASSEAMMNAVVHAGDSTVEICADSETIQVWIRDSGKGIKIENLPRATLGHGWSSVGTLGMGFSMILSLADGVDLLTGTNGTVMVLTVGKQTTGPSIPTLVGMKAH